MKTAAVAVSVGLYLSTLRTIQAALERGDKIEFSPALEHLRVDPNAMKAKIVFDGHGDGVIENQVICPEGWDGELVKITYTGAPKIETHVIQHTAQHEIGDFDARRLKIMEDISRGARRTSGHIV